MRTTSLVIVALSISACTLNFGDNARGQSDADPGAGCQAEICNGLDDDCDGVIDEDLGTQSCGVGACAVTAPVCVDGHLHPCAALAPAAAEICDGVIDDDCNGVVDDGCACSNGGFADCYGGEPDTAGVGRCRGGTATCADGTWGRCDDQVVPVVEVCNGADDDCDGAIDEGFGDLWCGTGVCARTVEECVEGVPQTCTPLPAAGVEVCDGLLDEDCDGSVDEGCGCHAAVSCYSAPAATSGVGRCHPGTQACVDGLLGACQGEVVPATEICDGAVDEDCDGIVDEGCQCVTGSQRSCYTGPAATLGVGPCHAGTESCVDGAWSGCAGEVVPTLERCNDVDDDCDGTVDNREADAACASGVCTAGVCQAPSCFDQVRNGGESDVDCGGPCTATCALGQACAGAADCSNQQCVAAVCANLNGCNPTNAIDQTVATAVSVAFGGTNGQNYSPKCLRVRAGTVVTFTGNLASHPLMGGVVVDGVRVPAEAGPFVPISNVGTAKAFELTTAGTFPYYCNPHALNGMAGVVYVVP